MTERETRCRVSEISRGLGVDEDVVLSRIRHLPTLVMYLNEVIAPEWFADQTLIVSEWLDRAGELSFTAIADKLNISMELVLTRIVSSFATRSSTGVVSPKYLDLIAARVRGVVHALHAPKDVAWIAKEVSAESTTVSTILNEVLASNNTIGVIGNDGLFVPSVWTKAQAAEADRTWTELGWCSIPTLRVAIGPGKPALAAWLADHNAGSETISLKKYIIKVDAELRAAVVPALTTTNMWIDLTAVLKESTKLPTDMCPMDVEKIANWIKSDSQIPEGANWTVCGPSLYSPSLIDIVVASLDAAIHDAAPTSHEDLEDQVSGLKTAAESCIEVDHGIFQSETPALFEEVMSLVEIRIRAGIRAAVEELESARANPSVRNTMDSIIVMEEHLVHAFWELTENLAAILSFGPAGQPLLLELQLTLVTDMVNSTFRYAAVRVCGATAAPHVESNSERLAVIGSVPNAPGSDSVLAALRSLNRLISGASGLDATSLMPTIKSAFGDLWIVIGKQPRKKSHHHTFVEHVGQELKRTTSAAKVLQLAITILLSNACKCKITFLRPGTAHGVLDDALTALLASAGDKPFHHAVCDLSEATKTNVSVATTCARVKQLILDA